MKPQIGARKIGIHTLGCDKNTVDSEYIAGWLARREVGVVKADPEDPAALDGVVILTCGFIDDAQQESVHAVLDWLDVKEERGGNFLVVVAGCLSQTRAEELRAELPAIDLIAGVGEFEALAEAVEEFLEGQRGRGAKGQSDNAESKGQGGKVAKGQKDKAERETRNGEPETRILHAAGMEPDAHIEGAAPRLALDESATAYLKIADGCNYGCAFCSIPLMKGRYRSAPMEVVVEEARGLIARGAKEIILVAQDISAWGRDLSEPRSLPELLRTLCALPGEFWLRLMYFYPGGFSDELIETLASEPKICPYLDVPLQHLDASIIRAMKRPYSDVRVMDWIDRLRERVPDVALRTTFIVGFPGEGKKEFMKLLNGLSTLSFDNVGFFPFSPQDGTTAATMPGQVQKRTKENRLERLGRRQLQLAEERMERFVGRTIEVLVDGRFPGTDLYVGHSRYQAPEVDGMVRFVSMRPLKAGEFAEVTIQSTEGHDLIGETPH